MQSPSSASTTTSAICKPQGWADLPDGLLHSIMALLVSVVDLFAFAGTCHSWHAAVSSHPSKSKLCTFLPPLLVQPHISVDDPDLPSISDDGHKLQTCQVVDLANSRSILCCQIPEVAFQNFYFIGSSYGQLICGDYINCLVVDVFTGAKVSPPQLPFVSNFVYGMLTAPLASPNSHLLGCAYSEDIDQCFLLDWLIGSDSWSKLEFSRDGNWILQIVEFNDQFIVVGSDHKLYTLSLAPQLGLQEIAMVWSDGMRACSQPCLVVCRGMLLIIDSYFHSGSIHRDLVYKVYRLDLSTEPATCVEVVKLENDTLFVGLDGTSPFTCTSPGRWGGKSNCLYRSTPSVVYELGDHKKWYTQRGSDQEISSSHKMNPFWVYPSMLYSDGQ